MITREEMAEAQRDLELFEPDDPLIRLAELLSPASRIEPELIRHVRLEFVRDADVSVEQELWFSEFVRSRGDDAISLSVPFALVLRDRLRKRRVNHQALVESARRLMAEIHAGHSPVLVLEENLAWADVFDEETEMRSCAAQVLEALTAGRDGVDYWLARAWDGLPSTFKDTAEGKNLAQIAAQRGASIDPPAASDLDVSQVAHLLSSRPILLSRAGSALRFGVPRSEATHLADVPDTVPIVVEVVFITPDGGRQSEHVEVRPDSRPLEVGHGPVTLRCVDGREYRLGAETETDSTLFSIEMLPAAHGSCLLIRYGDRHSPASVVIDGGPTPSVARELRRRLEKELDAWIELLVVTHPDSDRIRGVLTFLGDNAPREIQINDLWFNGLRHMASPEDPL